MLRAVPVGTCSIFEATSEAAEIAQRGDVIVVFDFNGRLVCVRPDSDPAPGRAALVVGGVR